MADVGVIEAAGLARVADVVLVLVAQVIVGAVRTYVVKDFFEACVFHYIDISHSISHGST